MPALRFLFACLLLCGATGAHAEILKCKDASGQVTYTQVSCPPGTKPLELPDTVSSDTGSSFANKGPTQPLSPRAVALKKQFDSCIRSSSPECREFTQLGEFCTKKVNWDTADCAAVREVNTDFVNDMDRIGKNFEGRTREKCAAGDKQSCDSLRCPISLIMEGSDRDVRACSSYRNLPSTSTWAQMDEKKEGGNRWAGTYYCLKLVETMNPIGQKIAMRPIVYVRDKMRGGEMLPGYSVNGVKEDFPTKEAAIEAGCKAQTEKIKKMADGQ